MKYIKFNILDDYSDIIKHGITERGLDFMHVDYNSDIFKNKHYFCNIYSCNFSCKLFNAL